MEATDLSDEPMVQGSGEPQTSRARGFYHLLDRSIQAEQPVWWITAANALDDGFTVTLPPSVDARSMTRLWEQEDADSAGVTDDARIFIWGVIQMAEQGIPEQLLFTSTGNGRCFSLIPSPRSLIPLQWAHFGPGAIPDSLADISCATLDVARLLHTLNDVLGSDHTLAMPGLRSCLEHFLRTSQDFGYIYGFIRVHWHSDFVSLLSDLSRKQARDDEMRREVLREGYIKDSNIRPRRAWDLYSNRVLPYYTLSSHSCVHIPDNLWTVSHSWVIPEERVEVWTPVNGNKWPVPLPRATSLDHIRVELLNFGAEYVWLDVLCLRQKGRPEDEEQRKDEWKLDVPTIGSTYALPHVPCVTYFNGLGLVADASEDARDSERHWFKRVWTVQEYSAAWLPGGATGASSKDHEGLYCTYPITMNPVEMAPWNNPSSDLFTLPYVYDMMRRRHASTELDRVFGLAYVFGCQTLPVYDEGCSPEVALAMLFKHIPASTRTSIFLQHIEAHPNDTAILPSWNQVMGWGHSTHLTYKKTHVHLSESSLLGSPDPGTYIQKVGGLLVYVAQRTPKDGSRQETVRFRHVKRVDDDLGDISTPGALDFQLHGIIGGTLKEGGFSVLLRVGSTIHWLIVDVVGVQEIGGEKRMEVVKRGCIADCAIPEPESMCRINDFTQPVTVVYLPGPL